MGEMRTSVAMSSSSAPQTRRGSGRGSTKQEGRRDSEGLVCGFHLHPFLISFPWVYFFLVFPLFFVFPFLFSRTEFCCGSRNRKGFKRITVVLLEGTVGLNIKKNNA